MIQKYPEDVQSLDLLFGIEPWERYLIEESNRGFFTLSNIGGKKEVAKKFKSRLKTQNQLDIIVYIDWLQEINKDNTPRGIGVG